MPADGWPGASRARGYKPRPRAPPPPHARQCPAERPSHGVAGHRIIYSRIIVKRADEKIPLGATRGSRRACCLVMTGLPRTLPVTAGPALVLAGHAGPALVLAGISDLPSLWPGSAPRHGRACPGHPRLACRCRVAMPRVARGDRLAMRPAGLTPHGEERSERSASRTMRPATRALRHYQPHIVIDGAPHRQRLTLRYVQAAS